MCPTCPFFEHVCSILMRLCRNVGKKKLCFSASLKSKKSERSSVFINQGKCTNKVLTTDNQTKECAMTV